MPLVAPTGALVAMKGSAVTDEIAAAAPVLKKFRCATPEVLTVGVGVVDPPTTVVRVSWADPSQVGWALASPSPARRRGRRNRQS
jgi:16S rRNA (guanine527-N7)-methyltransferase